MYDGPAGSATSVSGVAAGAAPGTRVMSAVSRGRGLRRTAQLARPPLHPRRAARGGRRGARGRATGDRPPSPAPGPPRRTPPPPPLCIPSPLPPPPPAPGCRGDHGRPTHRRSRCCDEQRPPTGVRPEAPRLAVDMLFSAEPAPVSPAPPAPETATVEPEVAVPAVPLALPAPPLQRPHRAGRHAEARTVKPWRVGQLSPGDGSTPTSVS